MINNLLKNRYWNLYQENNVRMSEFVRFMDDGTISGYRNQNERFWELVDNNLIFLTKKRDVSAEFNEVIIKGENIKFVGRHVLHGASGPNFYLESQDKDYQPKEFSPTKDKYPSKTIGTHTYGDIDLIDSNATNDLNIGKFTSIGPNVKVICGNHNYRFVSNYPFKSIWNDFWKPLDNIEDHIYNGVTTIGNDVWIGHSVFIKGGINISDGAVIAAGSIVTKDVPPYAIVGGSPAKVLKYRFEKEQVSKLMEIKWWEWSDEKVNENLDQIMSENIDFFIEKFF
ncbi:CatB-related O-acetyltransferase [Asaia astilbis]|uniref:CatB-related O-acetyltransferase n=1 Tax=Asaia astilbis TaxID=610244 RepID=UPI0022B47397|nr:CatB-related O-acetyltransferase [Asaia astilbis]